MMSRRRRLPPRIPRPDRNISTIASDAGHRRGAHNRSDQDRRGAGEAGDHQHDVALGAIDHPAAEENAPGGAEHVSGERRGGELDRNAFYLMQDGDQPGLDAAARGRAEKIERGRTGSSCDRRPAIAQASCSALFFFFCVLATSCRIDICQTIAAATGTQTRPTIIRLSRQPKKPASNATTGGASAKPALPVKVWIAKA